MIPVTLTEHELRMAVTVGVERQIAAIKMGLKNQHGCSGEDDWTLHISGAIGELAASKAIQKYYGGTVNTFKSGADIGRNIQIRTRTEEWHDLIVRQNDRDEDFFVLVTGKPLTLNIHGWIRGCNAKRSEWLRSHGGREPAYFVPQKDLTPFASAV